VPKEHIRDCNTAAVLRTLAKLKFFRPLLVESVWLLVRATVRRGGLVSLVHMRSIYAVLSIILVGLLLVSCTDKEVSRVAVPKTNLTLVLTEDEKQMFRYNVLADGQRVFDSGFLGPHDYGVPSHPTVSIDGSTVTFSWRGPLITQFVRFDVSSCQLLQDSSNIQPTKLLHCKSTIQDGISKPK
jgi:hypothetical protein